MISNPRQAVPSFSIATQAESLLALLIKCNPAQKQAVPRHAPANPPAKVAYISTAVDAPALYVYAPQATPPVAAAAITSNTPNATFCFLEYPIFLKIRPSIIEWIQVLHMNLIEGLFI